jgi:small subunit ribosomal protein S16
MLADPAIIHGFATFRWPGGQSVSQALRKTRRISRQPPEGQTMVVIRLSRGGSKARPFYNIVVAAKANRRDGRFIERIGFYNPLARGAEESLRIAQDRLNYWTGVGAQTSDVVARLVKQAAKATATAA